MKPFRRRTPLDSRSSTVQIAAAVVICNGAQRPTIHVAAVNLVGICLLDQFTVLAATDSDKDDDHVLQRCRHCVLEEVFEHVSAIPQAQIIEERAHDRRMARIANRPVVE